MQIIEKNAVKVNLTINLIKNKVFNFFFITQKKNFLQLFYSLKYTISMQNYVKNSNLALTFSLDSVKLKIITKY